MVLEVSSAYAVYPSVIKLTFTGASEEFSTEVQLQWPRSKSNLILHHSLFATEITITLILILDELDLQVLGRQGGNDNAGPANRQPLHFNGVVQPL